ncbi:MAG TPA: hypothetical protein VMU22_09590 [Rhizomicrobium sp.]|nr:hypothetical protein [Rhizomicrobium sp.]
MSLPVIAGLLALVAAPAETGAISPPSVFAPSLCSYAVSFPWQPTISQSTATDGGKSVAADLVQGSVRYSAACIADAPGRGGKPLRPAAAAARMTEMAHALGVQHAEIRPLPKLGPACGQVDGQLGDGAQPYRIIARICIGATATFIAETVGRNDLDDQGQRRFLDSLALR